MADSVPANLVSLVEALTGAVIDLLPRVRALEERDDAKDAQIAELQTDRTTLVQTSEKLVEAVTDLQGHAETVTGDTGLTSQLGDLTKVPALQEQLAAAMPAPAEVAPVADASTGTAASAQSPAPEAAAA